MRPTTAGPSVPVCPYVSPPVPTCPLRPASPLPAITLINAGSQDRFAGAGRHALISYALVGRGGRRKMDSYSSAQWRAFRNDVIRLDNGRCVRCWRDAGQATLHVHHKTYIPKRKPWEYPFEFCETLCAGCHAAEHSIIPPKFGWSLDGCDDLGELSGRCDCCGTALRHLFLISHPNWNTMEVGAQCCDNLTDTHEASNHMESRRRYADRLKRFVSSTKWTINHGRVHKIKHKDFWLEIVPLGESFIVRLNIAYSGKKLWPSLLEAKIKAFELVESGEAAKYIEKQSRRYR